MNCGGPGKPSASGFRGRGRGGRYNPYWQRGKNRKPYVKTIKQRNNDERFGNEGNLDLNTDALFSSLSDSDECDSLEMCKYKGWKLYFPSQDYSENNGVIQKLELLQVYSAKKNKMNMDEIETRGSFYVDISDLQSDPALQESWPSFYEDLRDNPEKVLSFIGLAFYQVFSNRLLEEFNENQAACQEENTNSTSELILPKLPKLQARVVNFQPVLPLKNLKSAFYGKLVSVMGTVVRVSSIKPLCVRMAFKCCLCEKLQCNTLPDGKYTLPSKCASRECRGRTFTAERGSKFTETINWQTVRIQEMITDDNREVGRIPRTVECELTNDLVNNCFPGDVVILTGVVKSSSGGQEGRFSNKSKCVFSLYIHANCVSICKGSSKNNDTEMNSGVASEFSFKDLYTVKEIQEKEDLFRTFVASLCPAIYGHEMVKAGLVLGLFGGTQKFVHDKNRIPVRGDPHILIVGDPGLGKSQMLQASANIAPRGVFVCGNTTTSSGLTVTVCKDSSNSETALEAGALVLADQGCCCIDEFDKMTTQHQALLEAMEQQTISLAKAGIICNLPARTSILAAANPAGGHYNKAKTVAENLKMGSSLLSRFDLVFILVDKPDEEMDNLLSRHLLSMARNTVQPVGFMPLSRVSQQSHSSQFDQSLRGKLKIRNGETIEPIPHQVLRTYIRYARKYIHPRISPGAAEVLQTFYLELRRTRRSHDSTPITTRQLESLIRLTEARARIELRETATKEDASEVVEIMKYSMVDTYSDQSGFLDFRRSLNGSGMSSRSQAKKFIAALERIAEQTSNSLFTVAQMRQISKDIDIRVPSFPDFLESLNNQNYLIKKGASVYKLITSAY